MKPVGSPQTEPSLHAQAHSACQTPHTPHTIRIDAADAHTVARSANKGSQRPIAHPNVTRVSTAAAAVVFGYWPGCSSFPRSIRHTLCMGKGHAHG
jgi:hypothetical protein